MNASPMNVVASEDTHLRTAKLIEEHLMTTLGACCALIAKNCRRLWPVLDRDPLECCGSVPGGTVDSVIALNKARRGNSFACRLAHACLQALVDGCTVALGGFCRTHVSPPAPSVVLAAVAHARSGTSRVELVAINIPASAPPALTALRGKRRTFASDKTDVLTGSNALSASYLLVLLDGARDPLPPATAELLLQSDMRDAEVGLLNQAGYRSLITIEDLDDATDELVREVQYDVDTAEQKRFERAAFQAQRYIEDRLLASETTARRARRAARARSGSPQLCHRRRLAFGGGRPRYASRREDHGS